MYMKYQFCMNQEDVESIKELKNGSQLAFASIYKLYASRAYLLAFKYFGDKYMAEDAVQNAFIKLWNNRQTLDESCPIQNYLFCILKNDIINTLRDNKKKIAGAHFWLKELVSEDDGDELRFAREKQWKKVMRAVEALPPQQKKIFKLKLSNYSNSEIANMLNVSVNTIKYMYYISLKQIRTLVKVFLVVLCF